MRNILDVHKEIQEVIPEYFEEEKNKKQLEDFKESISYYAPEEVPIIFSDYYFMFIVELVERCSKEHNSNYVKAISIFSCKSEYEVEHEINRYKGDV